MLKNTGWRLSALAILLMVLAGCSHEEEVTVYKELREMPAMKDSLRSESRYEPLTPVMQDVYDRSIPEDVYSVD